MASILGRSFLPRDPCRDDQTYHVSQVEHQAVNNDPGQQTAWLV
jgi:hypothetical protein